MTSVIQFKSKGQRLAEDLLKLLGVKEEILSSFQDGKILKTNSINPLAITIQGPNEKDKTLIDLLNQNGLLVYHILVTTQMVGKQQDIDTEHEVSTFTYVELVKSYLCVPKDIFAEAFSDDLPKDLAIIEYTDHTLLKARQGCLFAYVINTVTDNHDFHDISVSKFNGHLIKGY